MEHQYLANKCIPNVYIVGVPISLSPALWYALICEFQVNRWIPFSNKIQSIFSVS
jgi:hypothetical protein